MQTNLDVLIDELLAMRKYRDLNLPRETVRDLLVRELANARSERAAVHSVREKLHNIVAPYLGDPDYPSAAQALDKAFAGGEDAAVRAACRAILEGHASTRERIPLLEAFYSGLFAVTGLPSHVLDLACGLNPFAYRWMNLPAGVRYHAYDLHMPRVDLVNHYFQLEGLEPLAEARDILVNPPEQQAQVAFFFKEAHRFEQRRRGSCREFFQALRVHWLLVSLPQENLTGRRSLVDRQRSLIEKITAGLPWRVTELLFGTELVFCIEKYE